MLLVSSLRRSGAFRLKQERQYWCAMVIMSWVATPTITNSGSWTMGWFRTQLTTLLYPAKIIHFSDTSWFNSEIAGWLFRANPRCITCGKNGWECLLKIYDLLHFQIWSPVQGYPTIRWKLQMTDHCTGSSWPTWLPWASWEGQGRWSPQGWSSLCPSRAHHGPIG